MLEKIKHAIADYNMFEDCGCDVVAALSGGADSVALLLALKELGYNVSAVHVNHNLRGDESDSDEAFCVDLCKSLGVKIEVFSVDVSGYSKVHGMSCEEAARHLRYECILNHALGKKVATAHTLSDNLETVVINIARGAALKGMCGIPPVRENIVRPLIYCTRKDVEGYLLSKNQNYVTDSTNLSDDFTRNKIRHSVIPVLEEINCGIYKTALNSKKAFELENSFIEEQTEQALERCLQGKSRLVGIKNLHKALRHRCIMYFLSINNLSGGFERISKIDSMLQSESEEKISVGSNLSIVCKNGNILLQKNIDEFRDFCVPLKIGKNDFVDEKTVEAEIINLKKDYKINTLLAKELLDYDKIKGQLFLRCRRRGDKIRLRSRNFTSSVKTLLNAQVPRQMRDSLCFVEDEDGLIFIEGIGSADRVKTDEGTKRILRITSHAKN